MPDCCELWEVVNQIFFLSNGPQVTVSYKSDGFITGVVDIF